MVPCEKFTVPPPTETGKQTIFSSNNFKFSQAIVTPTISISVSILEASWKWTESSLIPWILDSDEIRVLMHDSANVFAFIERLSSLTESKIAFLISIPFLFEIFSSISKINSVDSIPCFLVFWKSIFLIVEPERNFSVFLILLIISFYLHPSLLKKIITYLLISLQFEDQWQWPWLKNIKNAYKFV